MNHLKYYNEKKEELKQLSDDILAFEETEDGEFIPIKEPVEIEQVVDIIKDKVKISKIEENITVDTNISVGEVKRGDIIYLITSNSKIALSNYQSVVTAEEKNNYIFIIGKMKK